MQITVDEHSGFCPGVVSAIRKAEEQLAEADSLYCLGDIVHNSEEVARLERMGLCTIDHEQMRQLRDTRVLFRAHGEPPTTYQMARQNGIEIIDATCPVVLKLQQRIRQVYEDARGTMHDARCTMHDADRQSIQIVIFGKKGHAEVNGLVGQTEGTAIVIERPEDIDKVDFARPVRLFSQTTMPVDTFRQLAATMRSRMQHPDDFEFRDTICRQVANRIPHLREFSRQHDVVLFVSGRKSSNGKALFGVCHEENPRSYFVSHPEEVTPEMVSGAQSVGICGATSTPRWQMEAVARKLQEDF